MKALKTIIKLHKNNIDSLKIQIGDKLEEKSNLKQEFDRIASEIKREQELAGSNIELLMQSKGYFNRAYKRQSEMADKMSRLDLEIDKLREELHEEYTAKKQYEHLLDKKQKELEEKQKKQEENSLDEINMLKYNYNKSQQ